MFTQVMLLDYVSARPQSAYQISCWKLFETNQDVLKQLNDVITHSLGALKLTAKQVVTDTGLLTTEKKSRLSHTYTLEWLINVESHTTFDLDCTRAVFVGKRPDHFRCYIRFIVPIQSFVPR